MDNLASNVGKTLQSAYDEFYSDKMTEWRELGGKYKADNILNVCAGHNFQKVLECGAGEGSILMHLDSSGAFSKLYATEISDSGISQIEKRKLGHLVEVKKFDGYQIPYLDKEFDMVYCSHVLEHVEHPRILLRELARISNYQVFEIPLDYSNQVDQHVKTYLGYGHINIFTPSLFKFLLKSEGFDIIAERFTRTSEEVIRFNWYRNMNFKKNFFREMKLKVDPMLQLLRKVRYGKHGYKEYGYSAYTCLVQSVGELEIF